MRKGICLIIFAEQWVTFSIGFDRGFAASIGFSRIRRINNLNLTTKFLVNLNLTNVHSLCFNCVFASSHFSLKEIYQNGAFFDVLRVGVVTRMP